MFRTRHLVPAVLVLAGTGSSARADVVDPSALDFLPASAGVTGGAVGGFLNPAAWASGAGELAFTWTDRTLREDALDDWGLSLASPLGFAVQRHTRPAAGGGTRAAWDYRLGVAGGDRRNFAGLAWRWTRDEGPGAAGQGPVLGTLLRPSRYVSVGSTSFLATGSSHREGSLDLGVRPFGTARLTLCADAAWDREARWDDPDWSAGLEVRPVAGLHLGARLREDAAGEREWLLGVGVTLDRMGVHVAPRVDEDGDVRRTSYLVRVNPPHPGLPLPRGEAKHLRTIDLEDRRVGYRKDLWFDDDRAAWLDVVRALRDARDDPRTAGVALNLAGTSLRPSLAWELRREIDALGDAGKRVLVHADRLRMTGYLAASGAERISLDPFGDLTLPGVAMQRTYLKGLLDKAGIGFEEHRLYRYKTMAETYARRDLSEADREQLGALADDLYAAMRDGIAEGRGMSAAQVDSLVEREVLLMPERAQELGLVDAVERWDDLTAWARGEGLSPARGPARRDFPEERWGRPPLVALVYAEGECAVRDGIRGRDTGEHLRKLAKRHDLAAVVLRADSPGGDPLAADLVAGGLAAVRDEGIPVVVSQGDVAASGGYWISLDADHVLTTPLTITGSIGVISGWAWDDGFGTKTGLSADGVRRGSHADLFGGMRIPLLGARLPVRNLDASERALVDRSITSLYDRFVAKVAALREMPEEHVRDVAQGRVWSGADAVEIGLCDDLGGLADALDEARQRAGLAPGDEVRIEEYPPRRRFRLPDLPGGLPELLAGAAPGSAIAGAEPGEDAALRYFRALTREPGAPQLLLPPEALPREWREP